MSSSVRGKLSGVKLALAPPVNTFIPALNSIIPGPFSVMLPGCMSIAAPAAVSRMWLGAAILTMPVVLATSIALSAVSLVAPLWLCVFTLPLAAWKLMPVSVDRGRDAHCWAPPAQIRACAIHALGSHLGCLTAKRSSGQG